MFETIGHGPLVLEVDYDLHGMYFKTRVKTQCEDALPRGKFRWTHEPTGIRIMSILWPDLDAASTALMLRGENRDLDNRWSKGTWPIKRLPDLRQAVNDLLVHLACGGETVAELKGTVAALREMLDDRDGVIRRLRDELEAVEERLAARDAHINTLCDELSERARMILDRDETIEALEESIDTLNAIPRIHTAGSALEELLADRDDVIRRLRAQVRFREDLLHAQERANDDLRATVLRQANRIERIKLGQES